jgi:hypothetical protein
MLDILLISSEIGGSETVITPKDVLEELLRCDGQITDFGHPTGAILFDPTMGTPHPGERIELETFSLLRDNGWVTTDDRGVIRRYRISRVGTNQLHEASLNNKVRAGNA